MSAFRAVAAAWCVLAAWPSFAAAPPQPPQPPAPTTTAPAAVAAAATAIERDLDADRWAAALEAARRLVESAPGDPRVASLLGRAEFRAGRIEDAARRLEAAVDHEAGAFDPRGAMVLARLRVARGGAPGDLVERALAAAPDDPVVLFWAADVAADRGAARDALRRYLAIGDTREERVESARGTLELLERLADRALWRAVERPEELRLDLQPIATVGGGVGGLVVDSAMGPRKRRVRLLLDSGSGGLFVVDRKLRKAGFEPLSAGTTFGGGGDGRHESRRGTVPSIEFDGLRFEDALVTESERDLSPRGEFHGILGLSAFAGYRLRIDIERRVVVATRRRESDDAAANAADDAGWRPYWVLSGQMLVRAAVGDRDGLFLFDTGATRSVLDAAFADTLPGVRATAPADVRGYGGRVAGARVIEGARVEFQGYGAGEEGLRAIDLGVRGRIVGVELAGYLGLDVLSQAVIEIDTVQRRVRLVDAD